MTKLSSALIFICVVIITIYESSASEEFCETKANGEIVCMKDGNESITCNDNHELCAKWASQGECKANPNYMIENCMRSCEVCVKYDEKARIYAAMYKKRSDKGPCEDDHDDCPGWEAEDKCVTNTSFMLEQCRRSCSMCPGQTHSRPSILPPRSHMDSDDD